MRRVAVLFVAALTCPRCGHTFQVGWRSPTPPGGRDVFEVVCPENGSRFQFHAVAPPPECRTCGVIAESVEALTEAVRRVAPAPLRRPGESPPDAEPGTALNSSPLDPP
jgi:hypothetical protein